MYAPNLHFTAQTATVFAEQTNRYRMAIASGVPFCLFTAIGWQIKNFANLPNPR